MDNSPVLEDRTKMPLHSQCEETIVQLQLRMDFEKKEHETKMLEMHKEKAHADEENANLRHKIRALQAKLHDVQEENKLALHMRSATIENLKKQVSQHQERFIALEGACKDKNDKIDLYESQLVQASQKIKSVGALFSTIRENFVALKAQLKLIEARQLETQCMKPALLELLKLNKQRLAGFEAKLCCLEYQIEPLNTGVIDGTDPKQLDGISAFSQEFKKLKREHQDMVTTLDSLQFNFSSTPNTCQP